MGFSKSFPRTIQGSSYPKWEDIALSLEEENVVEREAVTENIKLMKECIDDAKAVLEEKGFKEDVLKVAVPLFEKRASHVVYWKERKCKDKFDATLV